MDRWPPPGVRTLPSLLTVLCVVLSGALACEPSSEPAEPPVASELLSANAHELRLEEGELAGPGAAFLAGATAGAQFVVLGEVHNNLEIPEITTALFRQLNEREGFEFLLLEQDPVMMQRVSREPVRGDREAVRELARRYPKGFTFISDQELDMIADVGAISTSEAHAIWGCEQAFGVTHALDELLEGEFDAADREFLRQLRDEAAADEAKRDLDNKHYISDAAFAESVDRLATLAESADARSRFLVDAVATSAAIYSYYVAGDRGEVPGYYSNNSVREEYMKTRCLEEYRLAESLDGKLPKGLAKHGHWHAYKGLSPGRVPTLGQFLSDLARFHDLGFFSIAVHAFNEAGSYGALAGGEWNAYLRPFASVVEEGRWTLIDLRPFREYPDYQALAEVAGLDDDQKEDLKRLTYGFDSVLLVGGARGATYEVTGVDY